MANLNLNLNLNLNSSTELEVLSKGANNTVFALQEEGWVGKLFQIEVQDPHLEYETMKGINKISKLMPKVMSLLAINEEETLFIMERLYPLQPRAFSKEERLEFLDQFLKELKELHQQGWAHGDIKRPAYCCKGDGDQWDNVIPTKKGIRLIDAGSAVNDSEPCFEEETSKDLADFCEFAKWFTKDVIPEEEIIPKLLTWMGLG